MTFPPPVTGLNAEYFGDSGGATAYYYWVQAVYPSGRANFAGPVLVTAPAAFSKNNVALVTWNPMPGAMFYDVVRTTTSAAPTGTATIGLAVGITKNSYTDFGEALFSYTVVAGGVVGLASLNTVKATYDFTVDGGAQGVITPVLTALIKSGSIIVACTVHVLVALTSGGSATIAIGTTAGSAANSLKTATAVASYSLAAVLNGTATFAAPVLMTADGSIDITVATADLTAGKMDIIVTYL